MIHKFKPRPDGPRRVPFDHIRSGNTADSVFRTLTLREAIDAAARHVCSYLHARPMAVFQWQDGTYGRGGAELLPESARIVTVKFLSLPDRFDVECTRHV